VRITRRPSENQDVPVPGVRILMRAKVESARRCWQKASPLMSIKPRGTKANSAEYQSGQASLNACPETVMNHGD
jgi:hypothetical protein